MSSAEASTPRVVLAASSDDFLLEHAREAAVAELAAALGAEPERLPDDVAAADLVLEVESPSLFATARLLVARGAERWLPGGRGGAPAEDPAPLVVRLEAGLPEDTGLVLAALTATAPAGALAEAVAAAGEVRWVPAPAPPKPWEEAALSSEQEALLRRVLRTALGGVPIAPEAERLLLERLGFEPRRLDQEARKLATASGGATVDEGLVRRLVLPAGPSLERVVPALEGGDLGPVLELVAAAAGGVEVSDWRGRRLAGSAFAGTLAATVAGVLVQALYLRRVAAANGLERELDRRRVAERGWYPRRFKRELGPRLLEAIREDPGAPWDRPPTLWRLSRLFRAAAALPEAAVVRALAEADRVEAACRGDRWPEALTRWLLPLAAAAAPQG